MEIVVENPEVPVGNLLENSSEILNFKLNNNAESETQETVEYAKKEEVILTPNGNGISNSESPFGRSISTNVDHHGSNEDLLEGFKTKRYELLGPNHIILQLVQVLIPDMEEDLTFR